MNENQNGCAEPIGQALRRYGVPETLVADIERDYKDLSRLSQREQPRTITLAYTPRMDIDERRNYSDDQLDTGGHWTMFEQGYASQPLDSRECLALVAAMLLGAKHPPLQSVFGYSREASRCRMKYREAVQETKQVEERLERDLEESRRNMRELRELHGSLPWEMAQTLYGELRRRLPNPDAIPAQPEDGSAVFAVPLVELASRMGILAAREPLATARREAYAESVAIAEGARVELVDSLEETRAEVDRMVDLAGIGRRSGTMEVEISERDVAALARAFEIQASPTASVEFSVDKFGTFSIVGVPMGPSSGDPVVVSAKFTPAPELVHKAGAAVVADAVEKARDGAREIIAALAEHPEAKAAASQDAELEELRNDLLALGFQRSLHELREWPDEWRIDAQNYTLAMAASAGAVADPWFLTGAPDPADALEPPGELDVPGMLEAPADGIEKDPMPPGSILSTVIAGAPLLSFEQPPAVPKDAYRGAPLD